MNDNSFELSEDQNSRAGFTLVELIAVIAVLAVLTAMLVPALARSQPNVKSAQCRHNLKQLTAAWQMYPEEYNGSIAPNFHGGFFPPPSAAASWASGWLDWSASTDNTNVLLLIDARYALLAPYLNRASNVFKCPSDQYLSTVQRARGWTHRTRSYSANIYIGEGNATSGPFDPIYKQIRKTSEFLHPTPAQTWVYVDEHPDSINDTAFFSPRQISWIDWPATYHHGGAALAFGDGHTEIRKWRGSLATGPATRVTYTFSSFPLIPASDPDIAWMSYRTPRIFSQSY